MTALTQSEKKKLKKQVALYSHFPTQLHLDEGKKHYSQIQENHAIITIGEKAPYQYISQLHPQGYELFMEGLLFHEIARLRYCDFYSIQKLYQQALNSQQQAQNQAKDYLQGRISIEQLKKSLYRYIYDSHLPRVLEAIEAGAVENALGIEYPETWDALMYARQNIINALIQTNNHAQKNSFLMNHIITEIMVICTYGYRFSIENKLHYLSHHLPEHFLQIRKLAIQGRLQTHTTQERLRISQDILQLCVPIMEKTVTEMYKTLKLAPTFSDLSPSLFSQTTSEIDIRFSHSSSALAPKKTQAQYSLDLSDEDFQRIESLENQQEKNQHYQILQDIHQREVNHKKQQEKDFQSQTYHSSIERSIVLSPLERTTPTTYGLIALRSQNESILRSNRLARLLKQERMYATKSKTKHKREYGKHLDQQNLYRATLDGRVFKEHHQGHKKNLCVYILVDTSESMNGEKIINTMKGCFELARVLQTLQIPFCISSHKALGQTKVQLTEIISFQDCQKRYMLERIFAMHPSGGTHEDIALEYVLKKLAEYKRHRKGFVFVLSDGDTHGVKHIHELTHLYKKEKDIDVIGIGIQTAPLITTTYPNSLFIEDIQTLPKALITKLKEIAL